MVKIQEKFIIADPKDNIATARVEIPAGIILSWDKGYNITVCEKIPFGHKMSLQFIPKGSPVYKYGQRIGLAMRDINQGELVHIHNLEGERGRSS